METDTPSTAAEGRGGKLKYDSEVTLKSIAAVQENSDRFCGDETWEIVEDETAGGEAEGMAGMSGYKLRPRMQPPAGFCPYCLKPVGVIGNWLAWLFGTGIHDCDFRNVKGPHEH